MEMSEKTYKALCSAESPLTWFCDKCRVHVFAISQDTTGEQVEVARMFQTILDKMSSLETKLSNKVNKEVVTAIPEKLITIEEKIDGDIKNVESACAKRRTY